MWADITNEVERTGVYCALRTAYQSCRHLCQSQPGEHRCLNEKLTRNEANCDTDYKFNGHKDQLLIEKSVL
jgi:hypothetical protein